MDDSTFDFYLVNGCITIFCGDHDDVFKHDVLNSSLYAELVAAREKGREKSWLTYTELLSKLQWTINSRESRRIKFDRSSLMDLITLNAGAVLSEKDRQAVANALAHVNKLADTSLPVKTLVDRLQSNVSTVTGGTHALLTIVGSDKIILCLQISFATASPIDIDILVRPVLRAIAEDDNNFRLIRSTLEEQQYDSYRNEIIKKLGGKIDTDLIHVSQGDLTA